MPKKVKLGLRALCTERKIKKTREIISRMENSQIFVEPDPPLSEINELVVMLDDKFTRLNEERKDIRLKAQELCRMESDLDKKLTLLAAYVESKARGNTEIIRSAGMEPKSDSVPIGIPAKTFIRSARETLNPGEVKLIWEKVKGAKFYNIELAGKKENGWILYDSTTKTRIIITDLKSGSKYLFRVQAVGSAGKSEYSEPVIKFAP